MRITPARSARARAGRTVLEGNKAGKEMFDKGELAAILRFGAANLFEEEKDAKVKEEVTERDQALYNESIDAILARAEVVDQRVQVRLLSVLCLVAPCCTMRARGRACVCYWQLSG